MDREAWRAVVHGVVKSRTWLSDWTGLNWVAEFGGKAYGRRNEKLSEGNQAGTHTWSVGDTERKPLLLAHSEQKEGGARCVREVRQESD